jgi:hypothetical protein
MIAGLAHVNMLVPPGTLELANDFYGNTLGLKPRPVPAAQKGSLAWFDIGDSGQQIHIAFGFNEEKSSRHPCFKLESGEKLLELRQRVWEHYERGGDAAPREADKPGAVNSGVSNRCDGRTQANRLMQVRRALNTPSASSRETLLATDLNSVCSGLARVNTNVIVHFAARYHECSGSVPNTMPLHQRSCPIMLVRAESTMCPLFASASTTPSQHCDCSSSCHLQRPSRFRPRSTGCGLLRSDGPRAGKGCRLLPVKARKSLDMPTTRKARRAPVGS